MIDLVKNALSDADLLDYLEVKETNEGYLLKPKSNKKNKKIKAFEALAGSAVSAGDDVQELIKMADRQEDWRSREDE